ncbi:Alpha/Beta hydrolase protein [Microdochium trichocladiopsis]|uniref:Alpha/Beta hydrolase protein n=1 Tax=Microdochium trichocladiopsis TaxID=1682393 RepID=A0A9P8XR97_9PEZI|nr:Alpha/Beta hydrolase protein [Microdochium trichocladiopsis]KAH7012702.1 Alpha/Beta hydrolase protein [Microdochium trichocladiopsis]
MSVSQVNKILGLPRPGDAAVSNESSPVAAPPESDFTKAFGPLLPAAQYITTPKGKFAYFDLPPSSSTTSPTTQPSTVQRVLLVHGIQTPALGLYPLASHLRKAFPSTHFVTFDLWGHGLSDTPRVPHAPQLFLEQVDTLLDHLFWPSAHLVGYSLGSTIVAGYTATKTARADSVVYVAPAGLFSIHDFSAAEQALLRGEPMEQGGAVDEVASRDFIIDFLEGGELVVPADAEARIAKGEVVAEAVKDWEMKVHAGHAASVAAIVRDGNIMDREEVFEKASATGKPRFAVLGEHDGLSNLGKVQAVGIEEVVVVEGAGHAVVRAQAKEVCQAIEGFWRGLD